jgi:hypothetical protein
MSVIPEFSLYPDGLKKKISDLVNSDKGAYKLYTSLHSPELPVIYKKSFTTAMKWIVTHDSRQVVVTTIIILDEIGGILGSHSILIWKDKTIENGGKKTINIYVFDPNGSPDQTMGDDNDYWSYYKSPYRSFTIEKNKKEHSGSNGLKLAIENRYKREVELTVTFPEYTGIRGLCEEQVLGYIDECGYCIFLNYLLIKHVKEVFNHGDDDESLTTYVKRITDINDVDSNKMDNLRSIFGETNDTKKDCIGKRVAVIMNNISLKKSGGGICDGCGRPKKTVSPRR